MQFGHCARTEHTTVDGALHGSHTFFTIPSFCNIFVSRATVTCHQQACHPAPKPCCPPPTVGSLQRPAILPCALPVPRSPLQHSDESTFVAFGNAWFGRCSVGVERTARLPLASHLLTSSPLLLLLPKARSHSHSTLPVPFHTKTKTTTFPVAATNPTRRCPPTTKTQGQTSPTPLPHPLHPPPLLLTSHHRHHHLHLLLQQPQPFLKLLVRVHLNFP
jgi:hypothetical protein